ncbi:MAG: type II toxin-antitoxin system VapC family toxin [Acidimicrobiia bacterium]|nr:type II toxin-antitoxin system VapC family toxin [Acidimicrobiia bacterium]
MPVVDASVVVDWVAPDADPQGSPIRLRETLASAGEPILAPRLLLEEVGNALLTGCRRGRWDGPEADRAFDALRRMPVQLRDDARTLDRAWELSRRYDNHPVYDMMYVALAEQLGEVLYTANDQLRRRLVLLDFVVAP